MKTMTIRKILGFFLLAVLVIFMACKDGTVPEAGIPEKTKKVNKFIRDAMNDIYLWYDKVPDIDYTSEADPKKYFESLRYKTDDHWSIITDDVDALEASFEGTEKSFGWSLAFGKFSNTGTVFAIVEFVYPHTPAETAGIKRGDIIVQMNGSDITTSNYTDLLYGENITVSLGILTSNGIAVGETKSLSSLILDLNPVVKTSVVNYGGHKIGYIFYAQFIDNYNDAIDSALTSLLDQNVTDLVIDLRYNPGGMISAAQHLCSSLAPVSVVNNDSKLVTFQWNDKYQKYFVDNHVMSQIQVDFDHTVGVKMDLDKVHILTGTGTASASELTITGLSPYMSVTTVGDTTYGKYTASITLKPEDYYDSESYYGEIDNWGLQPIVLRYANAWGVTDFKDGFAPDILIPDDLFDTYPLGDIRDPLFKAAIEDITGTTITAMKSAVHPEFGYTIFDRGFSRFDRNKQNLLMNDTEKTQVIREKLIQ
jgi:carboxyl-terminal processing protease